MGNGASDPHMITVFPDLYADSRGQQAKLPIDTLSSIVQKQINWRLQQKKANENTNANHVPCNESDIAFMISNFFTLRPYKPLNRSEINKSEINKNWIYATLYIYDIFEEYSPFKMNYLAQNEWINEIFVCCSHLSNDMDLYVCQLIDLIMKCWNAKSFTKYRFNDKNNRNKSAQFIEFKSFYVLNHCLNKKNYLKSFKTTPKNVKIYIYKIIENMQLNPIRNRGNIALKLIEWFMSPKLIKNNSKSSKNNHNSSNIAKYRLTFIDILKIVVLRIGILKKRYKNTAKDKIELAILELNNLLTKLKKLISNRKILDSVEYNQIIHKEILSFINKNHKIQSAQNTPNTPNTPITPQINRKLLSETDVLEFIKIIIELRPNLALNMTALDLTQKYNLHKIAHFLQTKMSEANRRDSENEDSNDISEINENIHELFTKKKGSNSSKTISRSKHKHSNSNTPTHTQYLRLKPAKTLPQKIETNNNNSNALRRHKHSKSDLLTHNKHSQKYIDYLTASNDTIVTTDLSVQSLRKNAMDFAMDTTPNNFNPYYIVDDDEESLNNLNNANLIIPHHKHANHSDFYGGHVHHTTAMHMPPMPMPTHTTRTSSNWKQNELESRIERLENENILLKSDVRSLRNLVSELTNTVQQIIHTQQ